MRRKNLGSDHCYPRKAAIRGRVVCRSKRRGRRCGSHIALLFIVLSGCSAVDDARPTPEGDLQCEYGGNHTPIKLSPLTTENGVETKRTVAPKCWSIRQNDGSRTQVVFYTGKVYRQTPGPEMSLTWRCVGHNCAIWGRFDFVKQTFRSEVINYQLIAYNDRGEEIFTVQSGPKYDDCKHDGPTTIEMLIPPREPPAGPDPKNSHENFLAALYVRALLARNDNLETACPKLTSGPEYEQHRKEFGNSGLALAVTMPPRGEAK